MGHRFWSFAAPVVPTGKALDLPMRLDAGIRAWGVTVARTEGRCRARAGEAGRTEEAPHG